MAKEYNLWRGNRRIKIKKETEVFTAIIKEEKVLEALTNNDAVEKVKQVYKSVYKIKTASSDQDGYMNELRKTYNSSSVFHHAYNPVGDSSTRYYLTDMIVVCFQAKTSNSKIESIMKKHGVRYLKQFDNQINTFLFKVTSTAGMNPVKVCNALKEVKEVVFAEANLINRFDYAHTPKDDLFKNQWHLKSKSGIEMVKGADVQATKAWDITKGSRNVVVAVVDDGFDLNHPDLSGPGKVVHPRDFADGDLLPLPVIMNDDYHGTPCAGVAIGEENGEGIVGIAPDCALCRSVLT